MLLLRKIIRATPIKSGNIHATPMPDLILSPASPATAPASVGPPEQPKSPASANNANRSVPLPFTRADAALNVPGQEMPTEKPANPQPRSAMTELGTNVMII